MFQVSLKAKKKFWLPGKLSVLQQLLLTVVVISESLSTVIVNMAEFYQNLSFVTEEVRAKMAKCTSEPVNVRGCRFWTGAKTTEGYGRLNIHWTVNDNIHLPKIIKQERAHRIAYMLKINIFIRSDLPVRIVLPDGRQHHLEVSHLCHNKLCILPEHLTHEAQRINQARRHCVCQGVCTKCHDGQPNCLL